MSIDISGYRDKLTQTFEEQGHVLLRGMYAPDVVAGLRAYADGVFDGSHATSPGEISGHPRFGDIRLDIFNRYPLVGQQVFLQSTLTFHLQLLLGRNFLIIPESGMHRNGFGGLHKDVKSHQDAGLTFHWGANFQIVTVAIYLQANTVEYGGGIQIIPGSHRVRFPDYLPDAHGHPVPSEAGDVVVFNHMLDHKASWPAGPVPPDKTKYAIFCCASRNDAHARNYLAYLKQRPVYQYLHNYTYPEPLRAKAQHDGFELMN